MHPPRGQDIDDRLRNRMKLAYWLRLLVRDAHQVVENARLAFPADASKARLRSATASWLVRIAVTRKTKSAIYSSTRSMVKTYSGGTRKKSKERKATREARIEA